MKAICELVTLENDNFDEMSKLADKVQDEICKILIDAYEECVSQRDKEWLDGYTKMINDLRKQKENDK